MGNTLYWRTIPLEPIEEGIDALRHTLAKKVFKDGLDFGETEGMKERINELRNKVDKYEGLYNKEKNKTWFQKLIS